MKKLDKLSKKITFTNTINAKSIILNNIDHGGYVSFIGLHGFSEYLTNNEYFKSINNSKFIFCDSIFPKYYNFFINFKFLNKSPGPDVLSLLLSDNLLKNYKILFYGGHNFLLECVKKKYSLNNVYQIIPGQIDYNNKPLLMKEYKKIKQINPDIVIIGLGCPKQEIIADFFYKIEKKIFIIPVGAALNFVSGYEKRAPKLFRLMEIEFLWRFFQSPNMIFKRICNSLFNIFLKKYF